MTNKPQNLLDDLRQLLLAGNASTQDEICAALNALGHEANQSKVSRLLRKIGAVKTKDETGKIGYHLPWEPAPPTPNSKLSSLIIDATANETNILVNTSPGSAQLIARLLDYHKDKLELLGTIAGDDAVLVIPISVKKTEKILQGIKELLFL